MALDPLQIASDFAGRPVTVAQLVTGLQHMAAGVNSDEAAIYQAVANAVDPAELAAALQSYAPQSALAAHLADVGNPHQVTKDQVGLGNVANLAPLDLPVSTATQAALASGSGSDFTTRMAAAGATIAASVSVIRTLGFSAAGDGGGATYKKSVSLVPGGFSSADGQYWSLVSTGRVVIEQFGGKADYYLPGVAQINSNPTDNLSALYMACQFITSTPISQYFPLGAQIDFGNGGYYFSAGINLKYAVTLSGLTSGAQAGHGCATTFVMPAGTFGICLNAFNTTQGTRGYVSATTGASTTWVRGISFLGLGVGVGDPTLHGCDMRIPAVVENCYFDGFSGNGVNISASNAGGGGAQSGNANGWFLKRVTVAHCGQNGLFVQGSDANAGAAYSFQCLGAQLCGIKDVSGLGANTYYSPEIDGYGLNGASRVNYGGVLYYMIDDTGLGGATTPGTNDKIWYPLTTTVAADTWVSGNTYVLGLPIYVNGASTRSVVVGPYTEGGVSHVSYPTNVIGGQATFTRYSSQWSNNVTSNWASFSCGVGAYNAFVNNPLVGTGRATSQAWLGGDSGNGQDILSSNITLDGPTWKLSWLNNNQVYWQATTTTLYYTLTGKSTAFLMGRSTPQSYVFCPRILAVYDATTVTYRKLSMQSAAPASGEFARGEKVLNSAGTAGGPALWDGTTAGGITTTAYVAGYTAVVGDLRLSNGNTYVATTGGLTDASGASAPSGTGTAIQDGAAVWKYLPPFVFSAVYSSPTVTDAYPGETIAAGGVGATRTVTVTGLVLGDVIAGTSLSIDTQGCPIHAWVSGANTVKYYVRNPTAASVTLAAATTRLRYQKGALV